ncbi:cytochrome c maturation protein CcmE [Rhodoferax sp. U11-2br]|uniref:cytochrome c maturation protein CcmE n=1 Tax=Rhodoferax sp. U11-2br TaxID=2838878 RepID=UPI001BEB7172|nr:cytochrome c maturation protein CcmE [Rhodoferax sp. U11-2br]MBT3065522.1 cytochrome c maturation protein CcmE [Rhodoferax sp. U11-2br]
MKPRHKRAALIAGGLAAIGLAAYFVLNAFESNLVFFFTPSQIASGEAPKERTFRVGGMVKEGSLKRDNLTVSFVVTDTAKEVSVSYTGILPDLFKEGKGVVAQGKLDGSGHFTASEVLAKHDENYMPPEAQHAMDQAQLNKAASSLK